MRPTSVGTADEGREGGSVLSRKGGEMEPGPGRGGGAAVQLGARPRAQRGEKAAYLEQKLHKRTGTPGNATIAVVEKGVKSQTSARDPELVTVKGGKDESYFFWKKKSLEKEEGRTLFGLSGRGGRDHNGSRQLFRRRGDFFYSY